MEPTRAKLFPNGASQAVRLPRAFRFDGTEVLVRREGRAVILEPVDSDDCPADFLALFGSMDEDIERPPQTPITELKTRRMLPTKRRRR